MLDRSTPGPTLFSKYVIILFSKCSIVCLFGAQIFESFSNFRGVHIAVATPGRLMDLLDKKIMNLNVCR